MNQNFPNPYERSGANVKVELYLFNYATKTDLKFGLPHTKKIVFFASIKVF